jgi:hypothetical protein
MSQRGTSLARATLESWRWHESAPLFFAGSTLLAFILLRGGFFIFR